MWPADTQETPGTSGGSFKRDGLRIEDLVHDYRPSVPAQSHRSLEHSSSSPDVTRQQSALLTQLVPLPAPTNPSARTPYRRPRGRLTKRGSSSQRSASLTAGSSYQSDYSSTSTRPTAQSFIHQSTPFNYDQTQQSNVKCPRGEDISSQLAQVFGTLERVSGLVQDDTLKRKLEEARSTLRLVGECLSLDGVKYGADSPQGNQLEQRYRLMRTDPAITVVQDIGHVTEDCRSAKGAPRGAHVVYIPIYHTDI